MKKIVFTPPREDRPGCAILIGRGILSAAPGIIMKAAGADAYFLISDSHVAPLYGKKLRAGFRKTGARAELFVFPAGEKNKNRRTKMRLEDRLLKAGAGRDSAVIALGGGVTGDLAGFIAGTLKRGIPYVQIPTSLLAQVDSSVGGKTAVNTPGGKNQIGCFHQPGLVLIDTAVLKTLPEAEYIAALGEVVKYAMIRDSRLFRYLEANARALLARRAGVLHHVVGRCCEIKAAVVSRDEKDRNLRKILNFGHTLGHALEHASRYRLRHGEATAIGMVLESELAARLGCLPSKTLPRLKNLLGRLKLPVAVPPRMPLAAARRALALDKKNLGGRIGFVFPATIGRMKKNNGKYPFLLDPGALKTVFK
jgi:3-dehydroquinate synthase